MSTVEITHADLVCLVYYLVDNGYTADEVAYAVEKPWKFADEMTAAKAGEAS